MKTLYASYALLTLLALPAPSFAANDMRDVVRDKNNEIVHNTFGNCVRTGWVSAEDECGAKEPQVQAATPAVVPAAVQSQVAREDRTVYFEFNKATIMASERQKLDSLSNVLKSAKDVRDINIVGYADRMGTTSYNERLSRKRALAVESYLKAQGYLKTNVVNTRWLGESAPVTECPASLQRRALIACLQKDRRVEIEFNYIPESQPQ